MCQVVEGRGESFIRKLLKDDHGCNDTDIDKLFLSIKTVSNDNEIYEFKIGFYYTNTNDIIIYDFVVVEGDVFLNKKS